MANTTITTVLVNEQQGHASVRFVATDTLNLADLATPNTSTETMTGMIISSLYWSGDWKLTRNGNTVFQTANNQGHWDLYKSGIALTDQANGAITATTASAAATLIITLEKQSNVLAPFV